MRHMKVISITGLILAAIAIGLPLLQAPLAAGTEPSTVADAMSEGGGRFQHAGKLSRIRVNEVNGSFGGCPNCITAEIVFQFTNDSRWFGLRLLNDANLAPHQAAVDLLRDAFNNDWTVQIDYSDDGLAGRTIFPVAAGRVTISK